MQQPELTDEQKLDVLNKHMGIIFSLIEQAKGSLEKEGAIFIEKMIIENKSFTAIMAGKYWSYQLDIRISPTKEFKELVEDVAQKNK